MKLSSVLIVGMVALVSCATNREVVEPVPPPAPPFQGNVTDACSSACSNLRRIDCPEGLGSIGGESCERRCAIAMQLRSMPLECWIRAESPVDARACGSLRCLR